MAEENYMKEGISLYKKGNYPAALTYFLSLPDDCGADSVELAYYLGLCYSKLKRYDDALLYLEQVVTASYDKDNNPNQELQKLKVRAFCSAAIFWQLFIALAEEKNLLILN